MLAVSKKIVRRLQGLGFVAVQREKRALRKLNRMSCETAALSTRIDQRRLNDIFASPDIGAEWPAVERATAELGITERAGGVNPGDRRAIYYLLRALRPRLMLEVGTHVGASTVHAVAALRANRAADPGQVYRLTTVDILDVNDPRSGPWARFGSTFSPRDMIARTGAAGDVVFVTSSSVSYLANGDTRYDLIFLDGDHSAVAVYQEVALASRLLNPGGVILLHDYFPSLRPLWSDNVVIPGPWLGAQRLKAEGAKINVLPLGALPWPTKLNSRVTSLALLVGAP